MFQNFLLQLETASDRSLVKCQVFVSQSNPEISTVKFTSTKPSDMQKDAVIAGKRCCFHCGLVCVGWGRGDVG